MPICFISTASWQQNKQFQKKKEKYKFSNNFATLSDTYGGITQVERKQMIKYKIYF